MARPKKEIIKEDEKLEIVDIPEFSNDDMDLEYCIKEDISQSIEEPIKEENVFKVLNLRENNLSIGTINIPSFGEAIITEEQMASEKTMKKLEHAIKIGLIKEV